MLEILTGASMFGSVPVLVKFAGDVFPFTLLFFRILFGAFFMLLIVKLLKIKIKLSSGLSLNLVFFAVLLLLGNGFYFLSLRYISIASAVLLLYSYSIFVVVFSRFWLGEHIGMGTLIALFVSIIGVLLVVSPTGLMDSRNSIGYLFALLGALFLGMNFVYPEKYLHEHSAFSLVFYQMSLQIPFLIVFCAIFPPVLSYANLGVFMTLGLIGTALPYFMVYNGARKVRRQYVGVLQTTEVLSSIILGIVILSELPGLSTLLGGALLIGGYIIVALSEFRNP